MIERYFDVGDQALIQPTIHGGDRFGCEKISTPKISQKFFFK